MPKLQSYYEFIIVVEADFGSALNSPDQVGFLKFEPGSCPKNYYLNSFKAMSIGHSQDGLVKLTSDHNQLIIDYSQL